MACTARARVRAVFNTEVSPRAFVQYNSAASLATADVQSRHNFAQGNDLGVIYNENVNVDRDRLGPALPVLPRTDERSILIKYTDRSSGSAGSPDRERPRPGRTAERTGHG